MAKPKKPSKVTRPPADPLQEPEVVGEAVPEQGPSDRILKILKGLGAEQPVQYEEDERDPEATLSLSPSETRERDRFRARYGGYTKPGPKLL